MVRSPTSMDEEETLSLIIVAIIIKKKKRDRRKKRAMWRRSWIARRSERGAFSQLLPEILYEDEVSYRNFLRMNKGQFDTILLSLI